MQIQGWNIASETITPRLSSHRAKDIHGARRGKFSTKAIGLNRTLGLWNLIIIGMVIIQPTAPMGIYGVISNKAHGHVVTTILLAMIAMLFTPSAMAAWRGLSQRWLGLHLRRPGDALRPRLCCRWGMVMDYLINPLICTAFCAKAAMNILPASPSTSGLSFSRPSSPG